MQLPVSKMVFLIKKMFEQGPKKIRKCTEYLYRKQKEEIESINIQLPVLIFVPFGTQKQPKQIGTVLRGPKKRKTLSENGIFDEKSCWGGGLKN